MPYADKEKRREAIRRSKQRPEYKQRQHDLYLRSRVLKGRYRTTEAHKKALKSAKNKRYREKYPERHRARLKVYYTETKHRRAEKILKRRKEDLLFRLQRNIRSRFGRALRGGYKGGSAIRDLGCSISELKKHIASLFSTGMTWGNYGTWHIDHKVPLYRFDLSKPTEVAKACHFTNLRPLWAADNLRKNRYDTCPTHSS